MILSEKNNFEKGKAIWSIASGEVLNDA